jgi:hypothetical protein
VVPFPLEGRRQILYYPPTLSINDLMDICKSDNAEASASVDFSCAHPSITPKTTIEEFLQSSENGSVSIRINDTDVMLDSVKINQVGDMLTANFPDLDVKFSLKKKSIPKKNHLKGVKKLFPQTRSTRTRTALTTG